MSYPHLRLETNVSIVPHTNERLLQFTEIESHLQLMVISSPGSMSWADQMVMASVVSEKWMNALGNQRKAPTILINVRWYLLWLAGMIESLLGY
jgi:hypothetical protein